MKIYNMDDCTWIAAADVDDAWRGFAEFMGYKGAGAVEEARADHADYIPEELTDEQLDRLTFHAHDLSDGCPEGINPCPEACTFREQLAHMERQGESFPCFFATTEY